MAALNLVIQAYEPRPPPGPDRVNRTYNSSTSQKCDPKLLPYLLEMFSFKSSLDNYTSRVLREITVKTLHQEFHQC